jgi:hypothetical protein
MSQELNEDRMTGEGVVRWIAATQMLESQVANPRQLKGLQPVL